MKCRLCPRDSAADESLIAWIKQGSMFTHHQKSVILDAQLPNMEQRQLVAYMGDWISVMEGQNLILTYTLCSTKFVEDCLARMSQHKPNLGGKVSLKALKQFVLSRAKPHFGTVVI